MFFFLYKSCVVIWELYVCGIIFVLYVIDYVKNKLKFVYVYGLNL